MLAVEVLSPSTRRKDLLLKRSKYEEAGVASFWVLDPDKPSFSAFELIRGEYQAAAEVVGDQSATLDQPFPVEVTPAALITR